MSTTRAARARLASTDDEPELPSDGLKAASGPAFVPFQLADEMYANIFRHPAQYGYPIIDAGVVRSPKFGYLFIERRTAGQRRPKLVDGLDWVPSSAANASTRILQDGVTELIRYYCARRTKSDVAKPHVKPYVVFQRSVYENIKNANPRATTYDIKAFVGERWRSMTDSQKQPFKFEAQRTNRSLRRRMSGADPEQLLVRHEMWLQSASPCATTAVAETAHRYNSPAAAAAAAAVAGVQQPLLQPTLVLVHYLGDDAYQCLTVPPRPIIVNDIAYPVPKSIDSPVVRGQHPLLCHPARIAPALGAETMSTSQQTATTQLREYAASNLAAPPPTSSRHLLPPPPHQELLCVPATPMVLPATSFKSHSSFVDRMPHFSKHSLSVDRMPHFSEHSSFVDRMPHFSEELTSSSLSPESPPPDDEPVALPALQASSSSTVSPSVGREVGQSDMNVSSALQELPPLTWYSTLSGDDACSAPVRHSSPQMDDTDSVEGFFNGDFKWL